MFENPEYNTEESAHTSATAESLMQELSQEWLPLSFPKVPFTERGLHDIFFPWT